MRVIRAIEDLPRFRCGVATVGSYDGVHRGHRVLLDEVVARAKRCGGESVVLTFEPHPRITLGDAEGLQLLTSLDERCALLEEIGIDYVVVIPFDRAFSQLSHEEFVNEYLIGKLHLSQFVVGYNHRFGRNNEGNYSYLVEQGGLQVVEVPQYRCEGDKVSSTIIRQTISEGDMARATQLLGHPYIIIGMAEGDGTVRGCEYKLLPKEGRYRASINGKLGEVEVSKSVLRQNVVKSDIVKIELL